MAKRTPGASSDKGRRRDSKAPSAKKSASARKGTPKRAARAAASKKGASGSSASRTLAAKKAGRSGTRKPAAKKTTAKASHPKAARAGKTGTAKPKAAKPKAAKPKARKAQAAKPKATRAKARKAQAAKPQAATARTGQPKATRPRSLPRAPKAAARVASQAARATAAKKRAARAKAPVEGARKSPPIRPPVEAYRGNKHYIFASYSHENMREVFATIKKLATSRYRIWYDEGVEPGNEWPEEVGRALLGCSQFIVFMSRSASESRNVRNEINLATGEDKNVLVVFLEPTELSEGMRLQIGTVQFLNRFEMTETEFLSKLKKVLANDLKN